MPSNKRGKRGRQQEEEDEEILRGVTTDHKKRWWVLSQKQRDALRRQVEAGAEKHTLMPPSFKEGPGQQLVHFTKELLHSLRRNDAKLVRCWTSGEIKDKPGLALRVVNSKPSSSLASLTPVWLKSMVSKTLGTFLSSSSHNSVAGEKVMPLPSNESELKSLISRRTDDDSSFFRPAPCGKGTETITDLRERHTLKADSDKLQPLVPEETLNEILQQISHDLFPSLLNDDDSQISPPVLHAVPHDLLVYTEGMFFRPHRDTIKQPGHIITLSITLASSSSSSSPSSLEGGDIVFFQTRHGVRRRVVRTDDENENSGTLETSCAGQWAAWFCQEEHMVQPVRRGWRMAATYNVVMAIAKPTDRIPQAASRSFIENRLSEESQKYLSRIEEALLLSGGGSGSQYSRVVDFLRLVQLEGVTKLGFVLQNQYTFASQTPTGTPTTTSTTTGGGVEGEDDALHLEPQFDRSSPQQSAPMCEDHLRGSDRILVALLQRVFADVWWPTVQSRKERSSKNKKSQPNKESNPSSSPMETCPHPHHTSLLPQIQPVDLMMDYHEWDQVPTPLEVMLTWKTPDQWKNRPITYVAEQQKTVKEMAFGGKEKDSSGDCDESPLLLASKYTTVAALTNAVNPMEPFVDLEADEETQKTKCGGLGLFNQRHHSSVDWYEKTWKHPLKGIFWLNSAGEVDKYHKRSTLHSSEESLWGNEAAFGMFHFHDSAIFFNLPFTNIGGESESSCNFPGPEDSLPDKPLATAGFGGFPLVAPAEDHWKAIPFLRDGVLEEELRQCVLCFGGFQRTQAASSSSGPSTAKRRGGKEKNSSRRKKV